MKPRVLFLVVAAALFGAALFAGLVAAAPPETPIVGGSSFATAVVISPLVEYSAEVSSAHQSDYFYFDVTPGQIVTVYFTSTTTWAGANFKLWDQNHLSALRTQFVSGPEQSYQFVYVGNSTTPTRYYLTVQYNAGTSQYLFQVALADQTDGNVTGDAGETLATARVITPSAGGTTSYSSNTLGSGDATDWFRIDAASGQLFSTTLTVLDFGSAPSLLVNLKDQGGTLLVSDSVVKPDTVSKVLSWMSNNSTPSAYLLEIRASPGPAVPLRYRFDVTLGQQNDAAMQGDAGDTFDTARVVTLNPSTPKFDAPSNLLGNADTNDYFLIKLPVVPIGEPLTPYRFYLDSIVWPAGTGSLRIDFYDALRTPIPGMMKIINAPSTAIYTVDMTVCGSGGCYVKTTTGFSASNRLQYAIRALPPLFTYLPFSVR
jgi:hypothetical protein